MIFQSPGAVAFELGPFTIHWYGILIAIAFIVALLICCHVAKEKNENPDNFTDLATYVLIFAIIGARLYYVIFNFSDYENDIISIFKIWQGGLAIHGGIIGGLIAGFVFTKVKKLSFPKYCDITCLGLIIGQAIGRWGNFFNSEAFGTPADLPWKLYIPPDKRPAEFLYDSYFHPTFLYESLWNFIVFFILYFALRKPLNKYNGALFFCYMGLYSLGRFFIEGLRTDSLMVFNLFRTAQVISILFIVISAISLFFILRKNKNSNISSN
ncbi:MAG: prolipoprotein diacylglyceryl transferase [Cyanobacteriota bacterium]